MSNIEEILTSIGVSRLLGLMCGFRGPWPRQTSLFGKIYASFTDILLVFNFTVLVIHFISPGVSLPDRCITGFPVFALCLVFFRQLYFFCRRRRFEKLVMSYSEGVEGYKEDAGQMGVRRCFTQLLLLLNVATMGPWCATPLLTFWGPPEERRLAVPASYPFDITSDFVFLALVVSQSLGATFTPMKNIAFDDLFFSLGMAQLSRFRRLAGMYARLFTVYCLEEDGTVSYLDYNGRRVTPHTAQQLLERELRRWIEQHQQCISQMKELQTLYSPTLLMLFAFQILQLCTNAFVVAAAPLSTLQLVFCTLYVLGQALELLFTCRIGDLLIAESACIDEGIVDSGCLTACHTSLKSSILITLTRCQQLYKMSAIGVFPLNTDTFRAIILSSYSYFMVLVNMKKTFD